MKLDSFTGPSSEDPTGSTPETSAENSDLNAQPVDEPVLQPDASLEDLRQILFRSQIEKIDELETGLNTLAEQVNDEDLLVKTIAPVLGEAIRLRINEAREEIIEALYPVIGRIVQRAVVEAVSDLARSLDAQVKRSFNLRLAWWRLRARFSGASQAQIHLRELLPFSVTDVMLIHRDSGLLLCHLSSDFSEASDVDLFSGMLTAIRDFCQNTLGGDEESGLGEITYSDQHIMIQAARHTYLAVIVNGAPPPSFRAEMSDCLAQVEITHAEVLRDYQGDNQALASAPDSLKPLLTTAEPQKLSPSQKRILAGALGGTMLVLVLCGLFTFWVFQLGRQSIPAPVITIVPTTAVPTFTPLPPTATSTPTPTNSPTPTLTATFTLVPTSTASPTPTLEPFLGVTLGTVWMRTAPALDASRFTVLPLGERVEILAAYGDWVKVRKISDDQYSIAGWIPERWFRSSIPIPEYLITQTTAP